MAQTFSLEDVEHLLGVDLKTAEDVEMADVEEKPLAAASSPAPIAADDVASVGSSSPGKKKAKLPKVEVSPRGVPPFKIGVFGSHCAASRPKNSANDASPEKQPSSANSMLKPSKRKRKIRVRIS